MTGQAWQIDWGLKANETGNQTTIATTTWSTVSKNGTCTGIDCYYGSTIQYKTGTSINVPSGACGMCVIIQTTYPGNATYTFYTNEAQKMEETASAFALSLGMLYLMS